jgi:hypothetical protein
MLRDMQTGEITKGLRPSWEPLLAVVGRGAIDCFLWRFAVELADGTAVHAYMGTASRRHLLLAEGGRALEHAGDGRYRDVPVGAALAAVLDGWEDARPRPRDPEAVRALLARHGVAAAPPEEPVEHVAAGEGSLAAAAAATATAT